MRKETVTKTIFISEDGKEFIRQEDCENHEKYVKEVLSNIKYFCIRCQPDLTETGYFMHKIYAAVLSRHSFHKEISIEYALDKFGGLLGESVQGYGYQPLFSVSEVTKEEYEKCPATLWGGSPLKSEKIFLSPEPVKGFPDNIDYIKEWGFR